jgi:N-acetylglutamate synthase-like GNAT family acetyltransferase
MMVREARISDAAAIVDLLQGLYNEARPDYPFLRAPTAAFVHQCINGPRSLAIVVGDVPCGVLLASCAVNPFTKERVAEEHALFVTPEARGGAGVRLIREFEAWAIKNDCTMARLTMQHSIRPEEISKLYRRRGYSEMETSFSRRLK